MRNIIIFLLLASAASNYGQITVDQVYPTGSISTGSDFLRLVKLSSSGYKYAINDTSKITLYNLNHSVFKIIPFPNRPYPLYCNSCLKVFHISEELFNTNSSDVEYFLQYSDTKANHDLICDELGNILFQEDTILSYLVATDGNEPFITYTPMGTKMIIYHQPPAPGTPGKATVYSLPGTLTCHDCTNGTITSMEASGSGSEQNGKVSNYPNPSSGQTTVEYDLPLGTTSADLVFFNLSGQEVKRFKVTSAFHNIIISTSDLDAGTYFYQLQTNDGFKAGKKIIVLK